MASSDWRACLLDIAIRVPVEHLAELRQDVRYGLRARSPSLPDFTLVALLSLSLGICIATCAFSEMNGNGAPTPARRSKIPGELVALQSRLRTKLSALSRTKRFVLFHDGDAAPVPFGVSLGGGTERTWGHLVSASYFSDSRGASGAWQIFHATQECAGKRPSSW